MMKNLKAGIDEETEEKKKIPKKASAAPNSVRAADDSRGDETINASKKTTK